VPKRTFWFTTGIVVGAGSSLWAERRIRRSVHQAAARLQPDAVVVEVGRSARQAAGTAGTRVRDAVTSGRDEMLRREEELWAELAALRVDGLPSAASPGPPPSAPERVPLPSTRPPGRRSRRVRAKSPSHLDK
jgi:hypothetical protein